MQATTLTCCVLFSLSMLYRYMRKILRDFVIPKARNFAMPERREAFRHREYRVALSMPGVRRRRLEAGACILRCLCPNASPLKGQAELAVHIRLRLEPRSPELGSPCACHALGYRAGDAGDG